MFDQGAMNEIASLPAVPDNNDVVLADTSSRMVNTLQGCSENGELITKLQTMQRDSHDIANTGFGLGKPQSEALHCGEPFTSHLAQLSQQEHAPVAEFPLNQADVQAAIQVVHQLAQQLLSEMARNDVEASEAWAAVAAPKQPPIPGALFQAKAKPGAQQLCEPGHKSNEVPINCHVFFRLLVHAVPCSVEAQAQEKLNNKA